MPATLLYMETYAYYKGLIASGILKAGERMPSIRQCCMERSVSKTTAESAYFQLAADGYIISRERSGYFVSPARVGKAEEPIFARQDIACKTASGEQYDFSRIGEDASAFCFTLWQKYMKSAMRDTLALISYGEPQGEEGLREELAVHVRKRRNIYCKAEDIVIGASTQSLLTLLLSMLRDEKKHRASVPAASFSNYARVFSDFGFEVGYRNKHADIIYVSPSHMTAWGAVMPLKRRYEILEHSRNGHLIIEDDYQNDFNYSKQPCPSIYALSGGEHVVYFGSFSRILLPSIRISYMILPKELGPAYNKVAALYGQTASKIEQLALCRFLRDNHLDRHVRRIRKLYGAKRELLRDIVQALCQGKAFEPLYGDSGTEFAVRVGGFSERELRAMLAEKNIVCKIIPEKQDCHILLFSCGIIGKNDLETLRSKLLGLC